MTERRIRISTTAQRKRKLIVALCCAVRLGLAGLLLYYGGAFLAHTLEIDEVRTPPITRPCALSVRGIAH